jgi:hypothetical protein
MARLAAAAEEGKQEREKYGLDAEAKQQALEKMVGLEREKLEKEASEPTMAFASIQQLKQMGKGALAREVQRLNAMLNKMDMAALIGQARGRMAPGSTPMPVLRHKEAFMLMTYRTDGGTSEMKIWNSRDGVTPFQIHVDGQKYTHAISEMTGPYFDRPEGCSAQWETRTEAAMMAAWHRVIQRALLANRMTKERANALADDTSAARGNNLSIGLRAFATGRFTDEEA